MPDIFLFVCLKNQLAMPDALTKFKYFSDLKDLFISEQQARRSSSPPQSMLEYPKNQGGLPEAVAAAIGDDYVIRDDSPDIIGLNVISISIPMRKNSILLRNVDTVAIDDACKSLPRTQPSPRPSPTKPHDEHKRQASVPAPVATDSDSQPSGYEFCPECGNHLTPHTHVKMEGQMKVGQSFV